MEALVTRIGQQGRIVVPAALRKALDLAPGTPVVMRLEAGALLVEPLEHAVAEVQAEVARHVSTGESLVDELIAERRAAAADE